MSKRILHIALGRDNPEMEEALASMGEYKIIDWTSEPDINTVVVDVCAHWQPHLVFMQLQGSGVISLETMQKLLCVCCSTLVNWTGDVREDIEWYKEYARYFDYTMFTNETDVQSLRDKGLPADFLAVGFQDRIYYEDKPNVLTREIVFMANNYIGRFPMSDYRRDTASFLIHNYRSRFHLCGSGWGPGIENLNPYPVAEACMYRGAKIGISISHFDYERYYSDRMLRIMACGCFCLSYHYKGIEKDFIVGEHLDTFKSEEELKDKIDYYLSHDSVRDRIAAAGHKHVWDTCRWQNRIDELKKIIGW